MLLGSPKRQEQEFRSTHQQELYLETKHIQVVARCRPPSKDELDSPEVAVINKETKTVNVSFGPTMKNKLVKNFHFDKVFGSDASQEEVYEFVLQPMIDDVIEGFNCTVFAYGQSGTGKTYVIDGDLNCDYDDGFATRAVESIFDKLESQNVEFVVRVSLLEICK